MKTFISRLRAFLDSGAWLMILFGLILFSLRIQFAPGGWINLPVMFTILQTAGLMFAISGLQLIASMLFWPDVKLKDLLAEATVKGNIAAGLIVLGLFVFNGLVIVAAVNWVAGSLGAGIAGG